MNFQKNEYKKFGKNSYKFFLIAGDIGGTNTTLAIFGVKHRIPAILMAFNFKSKELKDVYSAINLVIAYAENNYKIKITKCCLGVAGALSSDRAYAKATNANLEVSKKKMLGGNKLKKVLLINDFEAIGYGISTISKKDFVTIKKGTKAEKSPMLVIGAGTGLGKAALVYDERTKSYVPLPSESGHGDFPAQNSKELELVEFVKQKEKAVSVSYSHFLSGQGLINIYSFLQQKNLFPKTKYASEIEKSGSKAELISKYRNIDRTCKKAFVIFKKIYARFARNFALDIMAYGGVYIAGGIAVKNSDIFDRDFVKEFQNNYKFSNILEKIPIYLITNYNIGLIGAGLAGAKYL